MGTATSLPLADLRESDIIEFSKLRGEPRWVTSLRLRAFRYLKNSRPDPQLDSLMEKLVYRVVVEGYVEPSIDVEEALKVASKIGVPPEELPVISSGFSVTIDNRFVKAFMEYLRSRGVILDSMDSAVSKYDLVKDYAFKLITPELNRKSAYHVMLWSGGPFLYVPRGVRIRQPIHSLFFIGREGLSQTEHTLIIVEEDSYIEWLEGCTTPVKLGLGVHLGGLEAFVASRSTLKVASVSNWEGEVHHTPIKRVRVEEKGYAELTSISFWAKTVNVAPTIELAGREAAGTIQNIGLYRLDQKVWSKPLIKLLAPGTKGRILNRTVVVDEAFEEFSGVLSAEKGARGATGFMSCNTLVVGDNAESRAIPILDVAEKEAELAHEAYVGRVGYDKLFYLALAGMSEEEATQVIVSGFFEPILSRIPDKTMLGEVRKIIELSLKGR